MKSMSFIAFLLLVNSCASLCNEGCLICTADNTCKLCDTRNGYAL